VTSATDVRFGYKEHSPRSIVFVDKMTVAQLVILWAQSLWIKWQSLSWSYCEPCLERGRKTRANTITLYMGKDCFVLNAGICFEETAKKSRKHVKNSLHQLIFDLLTSEQRSGSHWEAQWVICVNNQLDAQFFFMYVYYYSLHVSGSHVPIVRRINCINTTSGICHSV
jgi:hypothetical protein